MRKIKTCHLFIAEWNLTPKILNTPPAPIWRAGITHWHRQGKSSQREPTWYIAGWSFQNREWQIFSFHDKESYASEALSYAGSENRFLSPTVILICILSNLFEFLSFLSKENLQLWVGCCCDLSRQELFNTSRPDSGRIGSLNLSSPSFGFIYFSALPLCSGVIAAKAARSPAAVKAT